MAVKIKVAGKPTEDKPAPTRKTRTAAKPAAAKRSTKRRGTAPAAKRGTARTRTTTRPAKSNGEGPVRRASKGVDARTEARLLKAVEKAGDRRRKAEIEHKESINALHDEAKAAIEGGVSMAKVADASGISRQWLYKMGDFAEREGVTNGAGSKTVAKTRTRTAPAAKRTASKPAAKPTSRRRTTAKPASKPATSRRRVSIRS